ncbi:MAG: hypothetical protein WCG48_04370 [Candidatus Berkelbacteria bacterium]
MKKVFSKILLGVLLLLVPATAFAASNAEVANFTKETLNTIFVLASLGAVIFLIRGGYIYIASTGNPAALDEAKTTIRNALIGLALVISAAVMTNILTGAMMEPTTSGTVTNLTLAPIEPAAQDGSLAQVLLDAISGFLKNIIQSATKPLLDGVTWFLTNTPTLSTNSVVFNFWLIIVGITDSLFAVAIALLGLHVMAASSFGFEELTLKELLPKIGLAFLGANTSIFLIDWIIQLCQTLVSAVLHASGGIGQAWIINAFDPATLLSGQTAIVTLIFVVIFILLAAVLLLFYISRLMVLAFGAVISPLVCLLWLLPITTDFASNLFKVYFVTIFTIFVHVVIIQLASAFLTIPGQYGTNPVISIMIGIALFSLLLKSTATAMQLALAGGTSGAIKKLGSQLFNVMSSNATKSVATNVNPVRHK